MDSARLYYTDSYLTRFEAQVVEAKPAGAQFHVYLDRTAFYPTSGGQPFDRGRINGAAVLDVIDEEERIAHVLEAPLGAGPAVGEIDWTRRFDHMQQHTGQHLLSAVFVERLGFATVSFHLGAGASTIDLEAPELTRRQVEAVEARANAIVCENRPVSVRFYSPDEAASIGLRKPSERTGEIRVVEIADLDRSACGGTHVRATGEIGPILIRRLDRVRQNARVEFLCGGRAVSRARADYNALAEIAQAFSAPLDEAPGMVRSQAEATKGAEKARQKIEAELAGYKGRELYQATPADARGRRVYRSSQRTGPMEPWRLLAQSFTSAGPDAVFLLTIEDPPSLLLAVSENVALHAGNALKEAVGRLGGRGGGNARLAQGSLPSAEAIEAAAAAVMAATER